MERGGGLVRSGAPVAGPVGGPPSRARSGHRRARARQRIRLRPRVADAHWHPDGRVEPALDHHHVEHHAALGRPHGDDGRRAARDGAVLTAHRRRAATRPAPPVRVRTGGRAVAFGIVALIGIDDQKGQVPGLTVLITYGLAVASLAMLVVYVSHAGGRLRATGLIDLVGDQLHVEIAKRFPAVGAPPVPPDAVRSASAGVVAKIETDGLVAAAAREGCVLELCARMGDFVPRDAPLLRVHGAEPARLADTAKLVVLHDERTHDLDPAFGLRKLVDIAVRSASEDPTTTIEALHRIHDSLRQLAWRPFPSGRHTDAAGELRLIVPVRDWEDFVRLAFEEIRLAGAAQPQIARGLRAVLEDLKTVAPDERQAALDEQRELLDAAVRRAYDEESVTRHARVADMQGLG